MVYYILIVPEAFPTNLKDGLYLTCSVASVTVSKHIEGSPPPFDGPDYQYSIISDLNVIARGLKQGIEYFFRVSASNAVSQGPGIETWPSSTKTLPCPPRKSSNVSASVKDGSTIALNIAPLR